MRKLAEESQQAAREISSLIGAIQTETNNTVEVVEEGARKTADGAEVVEQTRAAFLEIGTAVDEIASRVEQIAAASQQVTASAASMQETISEVASMTVEQAGRDDACSFGKWLHSDERFRSENAACWQELHDLHERFHENAAAVLDLAVSGRGSEAKRQMETPDFQDVRRKLSETLTKAAVTA